MSTNGLQQEQILGNKFIIKWIIRNISLLFQTLEYGSPVASSINFIATNLKNTEWKLEFYPTGRENTGHPEIFLKRTDILFEIGVLILNFKLEISNNYGDLLHNCEEGKNFQFGIFNQEKCFDKVFSFSEFENFLKKSENQTIYIMCIMTDIECRDYSIVELTTSTIFKEDYHIIINWQIRLKQTKENFFTRVLKLDCYVLVSISAIIDEDSNLVKILLATINFPPTFSYKISEVAIDGNKLIGRKTCDAYTNWTVFQHEITRVPHSNGVETVTLFVEFFWGCSVSHELHRNYGVDTKIVMSKNSTSSNYIKIL